MECGCFWEFKLTCQNQNLDSVQMTFREEWMDSRLAYQNFPNISEGELSDFVVLLPEDLENNKIWVFEEKSNLKIIFYSRCQIYSFKTRSFFKNLIWIFLLFREAKIHDLFSPNQLIRIYKNGRVLKSTRLVLKFNFVKIWLLKNFSGTELSNGLSVLSPRPTSLPDWLCQL